jgi:hypothetical protein
MPWPETLLGSSCSLTCGTGRPNGVRYGRDLRTALSNWGTERPARGDPDRSAVSLVVRGKDLASWGTWKRARFVTAEEPRLPAGKKGAVNCPSKGLRGIVNCRCGRPRSPKAIQEFLQRFDRGLPAHGVCGAHPAVCDAPARRFVIEQTRACFRK